MLVHIAKGGISHREDACLIQWDVAKPQAEVTVLLGVDERFVGPKQSAYRVGLTLQGAHHEGQVKPDLCYKPLQGTQNSS